MSAGNRLKQIIAGSDLPPLTPPDDSATSTATNGTALVNKSPFSLAEPAPRTMKDIMADVEAKRVEQQAKLKRGAELHQQIADILNSLDV